MLQLNNLRPAKGARKNRKRLGRGPGSGSGTTASRGQNGAGSRSGFGGMNWFEGGQMPLYRRVPKRGFTPRNRVENQVINLADFERFESGRDIDIAYLRELKLVSGQEPKVKILGKGELKGSFRVKVHAVSASAREQIEKNGGTVEILPYGRPKYVRDKTKKKGVAAEKPAPVEAEKPKADEPKAEEPKVDAKPEEPGADEEK
jgi:large subunit ribosomal protein L15